MRTVEQAASAGLTGWLLTLVGYSEGTAFDSTATSGIFNISVPVPVIGFIGLAAILRFWYPLKKAKVGENVAFLNKNMEGNNWTLLI